MDDVNYLAGYDTAELVAEVRQRGFIVTERPGPIGRRYQLEKVDAFGDWQPVGGFIASTTEQDPDELCARWCATIINSSTDTGAYRVGVYAGSELVAASEVRTLE